MAKAWNINKKPELIAHHNLESVKELKYIPISTILGSDKASENVLIDVI